LPNTLSTLVTIRKKKKKRFEVAMASVGSRVDICSYLCVPWKMDLISNGQRMTNQQLEKELVLVARRDKG